MRIVTGKPKKMSAFRILMKSTSVAMFVAAAACSETRTQYFRNGSEALAAHGDWIPRCIPEQAQDVRVAWNWDTGETWGTFHVTNDVALAMTHSVASPSLKLRAPTRAIHWERTLVGELRESDLHHDGWQTYLCDEPVPGFSALLFLRIPVTFTLRGCLECDVRGGEKTVQRLRLDTVSSPISECTK